MKYIRATIKLILFFAATFGVYGLWFVGSFFIPNSQYWRQVIFRTWSRFFVWLAGMKVEIIGERPKPPFFLVANHLSYSDIPLIRSILECVFVAKREIEGWFAAGRIVGDMANIYVDRGNRRDIPHAGTEILARLDEGEGVVVFPEGTSTKGEEVLPFNSSFFEFAAKTDLPIHYASISYRVDVPGKNASEYICWWDDTSFAAHLFRLFQLRECTAVVTFGCQTVVDSNRKMIAKELWKRVNNKFIPVI
jgi:1-acyl-sn-glycerol-3-phosphate acyltransferase